ETRWRNLTVGEVIRVYKNEEVPADMILLCSSEKTNVAYVHTTSLNGETSKIVKYPVQDPDIGSLNFEDPDFGKYLKDKKMTITRRIPSPEINQVIVEILLYHQRISLNGFRIEQESIILRGSVISSVNYVDGIVYQTGIDTFKMQNSELAPSKSSKLEKTMMHYVAMIAVFAIFMSILFSLLREFTVSDSKKLSTDKQESSSYRFNTSLVSNFVDFFLIFQSAIPLSLLVITESLLIFFTYFIEHVILLNLKTLYLG
ncbi:MAG: hypothetical protein MHPSP_002706, partial [Paramarteilia canceri]